MSIKIKKPKPGKMDVHFSSATEEWATPQEFFDKLNKEFKFSLDACATRKTAKCAKFFSKKDDALQQPWKVKKGAVFMNPPYGRKIGVWIEKALTESEEHGVTVVCLLPARTDTGWFHGMCAFGEVRLIEGRLKFNDGKSSAPFPSMVVVFRVGRPPSVKLWDWKAS